MSCYRSQGAWPGAYREYIFAPILTHEWIMHYLALRRDRRIGMLWTEGNGQYFLAPLGVDRRDCARPIGVGALMNLIAGIEAEYRCMPVQSTEIAARRAECAA